MRQIPDVAQQALFTDAYRAYAHELKKRARFMINDEDVCEDIVQDVFMRMWSYMLRGNKIDKVRSFLHRVLSNMIVDIYRKRKTVSLDNLVPYGWEPSSDDSEKWMDVIDGRKAIKLIKRLPPIYQEVLRDKYARGLSYGEMSLITGSSRNRISVQVHRGLMKLKSLYNHEFVN